LNFGLRHVKKEIRVLGVALKPACGCEANYIAGVVFRGKLWLDGVMVTSTECQDATNELIKMIRQSRHYPQIRVIMLHRKLVGGKAKIHLKKLFEELRKPLIFLDWKEESDYSANNSKDSNTFKLCLGDVSVSSLYMGVEEKIAIKVVKETTRSGKIPEPLRVAELVVTALYSST